VIEFYLIRIEICHTLILPHPPESTVKEIIVAGSNGIEPIHRGPKLQPYLAPSIIPTRAKGPYGLEAPCPL